MKSLKYHILALGILAAGLTACQDDYDAPTLQDPVATITPNITIADFKTEFADATVMMVPYKDEATKTPYIIHGRVISSDASGNIYQNLVIQDETAAVALAIRRANMWSDYRVGQDVVLDVTGIYFGNYSGLLQFGWFGDYEGEASMTFMTWEAFLHHSQKNGLPNQKVKYVNQNSTWPAENPYCVVTTIEAIKSLSPTAEDGRNMMSQLVEIQNVWFEEGGKDTFAEYQESNERRYITDGTNRMYLNNSGYASFHNDILPEGIGTVRGILSTYQDNWCLLIRGTEDLIFDGFGTYEHPYSVEEAIVEDNNGRQAWVEGYIIGSVKAGVSVITGAQDVVFGNNAETLDNVIIAANAGETDLSKCMLVNLPSGSKIRQYVNMVDNPAVYGKTLKVTGSFNEWRGMHGITGIGDSMNDFEVVGMGYEDTYGNGTQESPYKVEHFLLDPKEENDVWVEGYIVGFVAGTSFEEGAYFTAETSGISNYNGANVIISSSATGASLSNSIPVNCDRNKVGLIKNPDNYGRKVRFKGTAGTLFGAFGMSKTTEAIIE